MLCIITAEDCPACTFLKTIYIPQIKEAFAKKRYQVRVINLTRRMDIMTTTDVDDNVRRTISFFPFIYSFDGVDIVAIFNVGLDSKIVNNPLPPDAKNLLNFYENTFIKKRT